MTFSSSFFGALTVGFQILSLDAIRRTTAHLPRIGDGRGELEDWSASIDVGKVRYAACEVSLQPTPPTIGVL